MLLECNAKAYARFDRAVLSEVFCGLTSSGRASHQCHRCEVSDFFLESGYFFRTTAHSTAHFIASMSRLRCASLKIGLQPDAMLSMVRDPTLPLPSVSPLVYRCPCASRIPFRPYGSSSLQMTQPSRNALRFRGRPWGLALDTAVSRSPTDPLVAL